MKGLLLSHAPRALPLALGLSLVMGCGAPRKEVVVIRKNQFFQCEPSQVVQREMVRLINAARASKRRCGAKKRSAVPPIKWNRTLARVAFHHSRDMANNDTLSHMGSKGTPLARRVKEAGYAWRSIGENISGGRESTEQTVLAWLNSPGHCANIMNPTFTEIGAACFRNPSSTYGTYWTLVLASPKK